MSTHSFTKSIFFIPAIFLFANCFAQNVGIGTNTPEGRLHIDLTGTANSFAIMIDDEQAGTPTIRFRKDAISKAFALVTGNDFRLGTYATNPNGQMALMTNSAIRMLFNANGLTGLGTTDPLSKLHIAGGVDAGLANNQSGYLMLGLANAENIVIDNNEILARNNGAASTLFLARDGSKVQLGNGSEGTGTKLHITSGTDVGMANEQSGYLMMGSQTGLNMVADNNEIQVRNNGNASHLYLQNGGGNVFIGDAAPFSGTHRLGVNGNAVITGNVRIGNTVTPAGYRLAVDGKAICTELMVRLVPNWPDYVFDEKYKLPDLEEVESFIKANHHLPGIPKASELEANGMNLGEMQKMQMEKIEELTLYIIDLKKEIEKLKKQN